MSTGEDLYHFSTKMNENRKSEFSLLNAAEWINRQTLSYLLNWYKNKGITKEGNTAFLKTVGELFPS